MSVPFKGSPCCQIGKCSTHCCEQVPRVADHRFNLIDGDVDDVAVVKAVAQSVKFIKPAPAGVTPFDGVCEALECQGSMTVGAGQPVASRFERYAG